MAAHDHDKPSPDRPPAVELMQLLNGFQVTQALSLAAQLRLADYLGDGPKSSEELAKATATHPQSLHRLLRALVSVGVCAETEEGRFALTALGSYLQADKEDSLRGVALMVGEEYQWRAWSALLHSVKTGETAFEHVYGESYFAYCATHPASSANFDAAMTGLATLRATSVPSVYDFSRFEKVIDVGGGQGRLLTAILKANPELHGILFDLPAAVEGARPLVAAGRLTPRCECIAGDFFESVPPAGDAYILSVVIHDWPDDRARTILRNCRQAMKPQGRLLLVERVMPARMTESVAMRGTAFMDLTMLVILGAFERTEAEFRRLLASAGFTLTTIVPTQSPYSIIEAVGA